jgi:hypothetical protein
MWYAVRRGLDVSGTTRTVSLLNLRMTSTGRSKNSGDPSCFDPTLIPSVHHQTFTLVDEISEGGPINLFLSVTPAVGILLHTPRLGVGLLFLQRRRVVEYRLRRGILHVLRHGAQDLHRPVE